MSGSTYDKLGRQWCLERISNLMRILADTPLACPYRLECLAQALLPAMSRGWPRGGAIREPESSLFA
jgi:hypothetical protein